MPRGGSRVGAGRTKYEPTIGDRNTVKTMVAVGIPQARIAQCIGDWGIDEKTLRKHFRRELDISKDMMVASVGQVVIAAAQRGESWAAQLVMKCQGGWKEASALELTGKDGQPITTATQHTEIVRVVMLAMQHAPEPAKIQLAAKLVELERGSAA